MLFISSFRILKIICSFLIILFSAETCFCTGFTRESLKAPDIKNERFNFRSENQAVRYYSELMFNDDKALGLNSVSETQYKRKSPELAFMIAFAPGFFIHGLGHLYVGDYGKATGIFGLEVLSLSIFTLAAMAGVGGMDNPDQNEDAIDAMFIASVLIFIGSWTWDMAGAPIKAEKINEKLSLSIRPEIKTKQMSLKVALNWK